jgi:amphi-Trp domain-containing protein
MGDEKEVEKSYSNKEVAAKLRRLAESLEEGKAFEIQIAGERVYVPAHAEIEFEYEGDDDGGEIEIEVKWRRR